MDGCGIPTLTSAAILTLFFRPARVSLKRTQVLVTRLEGIPQPTGQRVATYKLKGERLGIHLSFVPKQGWGGEGRGVAASDPDLFLNTIRIPSKSAKDLRQLRVLSSRFVGWSFAHFTCLADALYFRSSLMNRVYVTLFRATGATHMTTRKRQLSKDPHKTVVRSCVTVEFLEYS